MTRHDDLRVLRERLAILEGRAERFAESSPGRVPAQAVQIAQGPGWVASAGRFFRARPLIVAGVTTEGASGSTTDSGGPDWIVRVIGLAPAPGDVLVARATDFRWHAERRAGGDDDDDVPTPGCPCPTTPRVLTMTSSQPLSNDRIFQNASLVYQAIPASLQDLSLPDMGYLSTAQFVDAPTGDLFWYFVTCFQSFYTLTRLFAVSIYGSPYRDVVRYRWLIGQAGNTCDPFALTNGLIFAGGDATCVVTVVE